MKKHILSAFMIFILLVSLCSCGKKTVKTSYFDSNFNPFSVERGTNFSAVALTQESLLTKVWYNDDVAIDYSAHTNGVGIADITYSVEDGSDICTYTVKIGDDIYFSDGTPVTATDAVFSLYVCADIDYIGLAKTARADIVGLDEYRYHNSMASQVNITDEQIEKELENPSAKTKEYITKLVVLPVLSEEYVWASHLYTDKAYEGTEAEMMIEQYPDIHDLFAAYYALDKNYLPASDKDTLISDIAKQFDADYKMLGQIYGSDLTYFATNCARRALTEKALETMGGEYVDNISGIKIIDDKTFTVTMDSQSETQLENALGVFVVPFSVYGDDCKKTELGFEIDIDSVLSSDRTPVGAGKCVFEEYKEGKYISLSKNKYYYKETKLDCNVKLKETGNSSVIMTDGYNIMYEERLIAD